MLDAFLLAAVAAELVVVGRPADSTSEGSKNKDSLQKWDYFNSSSWNI